MFFRWMDDLITKSWNSDQKIISLRKKLNFQKSDIRVINCKQIYGAVKTGFFTFENNKPKIDICSEFSHDITSLGRLLSHELVHVYDSEVRKLDLRNNTRDLIRSEVRAYSYSGYCDEFWHSFEYFKLNCLRNAVTRSLIYHKTGEVDKIIDSEVKNYAELTKDL